MISTDALLMGIAYITAALSGAGCAYLLFSGVLVLRFGRRREPASFEAVPVTVLVPLCGDETGLAARLAKLRNQDYPAPVQIVCGVRDRADPAIYHVCRAAAESGIWPVEWHADRRLHGRNRKISNLINMMDAARHDILVMIDSDMDVRPDHLRKVVAELQKPSVGAVTCLYQGIAQGGTAARLAAMGINQHFLPNAVVGLTTGLAQPCFGATIAMTRNELDRIGGLAHFADEFWDDYAIGQAVREHGQQVAVCDFAPAHVCTESSMRLLFANQLRAARTIRGIDPVGHAGAIFTHPLPLALLAVIAKSTWWSWGLLVAALACRLILVRCVERRFETPRTRLALLPVCDLLSFAIHVRSYFSATIEWRGQSYRVDAGGKLTPTSN